MGSYRILSFDGGGLKGLISLGILKRISENLKTDEWIRKADLYAGTSTGGLIALALANEKNVPDIESFYKSYGPRIFNKKTKTYITSALRIIHKGYSNKELKGAVDNILDDIEMRNLRKKALITSFDITAHEGKKRTWAPKIFENLDGEGQDHEKIRQIALYTSAAPTYLPSVNGYIDGGVCANNPSMCALAQVLDERKELGIDINDIRLISIGTGINREVCKKKNVGWGILGWNIKLLKVIMDGSCGIADYQCQQILKREKYIRMEVELKEKIEMDDAARIDELIRIGKDLDGRLIDHWCDWVAKYW